VDAVHSNKSFASYKAFIFSRMILVLTFELWFTRFLTDSRSRIH